MVYVVKYVCLLININKFIAPAQIFNIYTVCIFLCYGE